MESALRSDERPLRFPGEAGYSLVEMIIATAVAIVVGLGIYAIFTSQRKAAESQKIYNDLQTSCGFAMDQIKRELLLAGYRAIMNPASPVSDAGRDAITFEYWDEYAPYDAAFAEKYDDSDQRQKHDRHTQVSYKLGVDGDLVRKFKRGILNNDDDNKFREYVDHTGNAIDFSDPAFPPELTQTLAKNVRGFALQYFSEDNEALNWNAWVPENSTTSGNKLSRIRSVVVSLECRAAKANPMYTDASRGIVSDTYQKISLQSEVRLRNIGIVVNPRDAQPPTSPANLRAWDPGLCVSPGATCVPPAAPACAPLGLAWDANTESDLAGYLLYYGLEAGRYSNRVRIVRGPGAAGTRVAHTLAGLQPSTACDPTPVTYFIQMEAFDKSGNPSPRSAEISGNPSPSIAVESTTGNDTTINPTAPPAPADFVASTPEDNQIRLSWAAPADAAGLVGYRLYRGDTADFTPAGRRVGDPGSNILADETTLTADQFAYLDSGRTGCVPVFYKLAAIACDPCLPLSELAFAAVSGSPTDNTKPPAPKIVARAGYRRVILSLENPVLAAAPDFKETRVFFNPGNDACTYPSIAADGTVSNGRLIPDGGGSFTGEGTLESVNFDDENVETPAAPNLSASASYCFLAVAYDRCNNHSDATDTAKAKGLQCGDCMTEDDPPQPDYACYNGPPAPGVLNVTGCYDSLELTWSDAVLNNGTIRDFAGYRVYRCENTSASPCSMTSVLWNDANWELLTGADPVWLSKFVDSPDKGLQEGHKYLYRVLATDCYWEQHHDKPSLEWPDLNNNPYDNATESLQTSPKSLSVGRIIRDPVPVLSGMTPNSDWTHYGPSPEFRHNTVLFRLRSTADTILSLKQATIGWENSAALLQRIAYGDDSMTPVTTDAWVDLALPLTRNSPSAVTFKTGAEILPLDDAIPVHLTFKRADGVADDMVNMRGDRVQIGISYRNESTGDESCSMQANVDVPPGPSIHGTTQDLPLVGTPSWAVPGAGAPNAVVIPGGGEGVTVYTNVDDPSLSGIAAVRLFYVVDPTKALTVAPVPAGAYPSFTNYTAIAMEWVAGQQWRTPATTADVFGGIPAIKDGNVWFFIVAEDGDGNFDRDPEPGSGAFQYYQQP